MIVYNKNTSANIKRLISSKATKVHRRKNTLQKLTKANKNFLKVLGFKT